MYDEANWYDAFISPGVEYSTFVAEKPLKKV